jgi:predicted RNA binding protein YcfA (HicA-like mRNA interferase family)
LDVAKSFGQIRKALRQAGWRMQRQKGSHQVWVHPNRQRRVVIAGKDIATAAPGTLSSIRRQSGLECLR